MNLARVWIDQVGEQEESTRRVKNAQVSQKSKFMKNYTIKKSQNVNNM